MPFFRLPRLVLTGPESSGKSVLAEALCSHLDGVLVREYLRDYFELNGSLSLEDALPIAQGQWANEDRGAEEALEKNRLL
uniref:AAA family ATPase n=1 Tax=uncultured Cohaesibacter sp. TaxID=1002546 RepID=UPI0029305937